MAETYLKKHLIGYFKDDEEGYVTGKFTGCTKSLVEGYITVTGSGYVRASSHVKGNSKRFKSANANRSCKAEKLVVMLLDRVKFCP